MTAIVVGLLVFAPMLAEAAIAARHDRTLRAAGAIEPAGDVYRLMALAYPAAFLGPIVEGLWRAAPVDAWFAAGVTVFALAKALKYWAIASLGQRWTFRVLVPPGSERTVTGPYRWLAHPNYVAVAGEIAGAALSIHASVTGPIALAGFIFLMRRRIGVEERALRGT